LSYTSLLINTCTVRRFTEGIADAYGTPSLTWADHLEDIACRLSAGPVWGAGREIKVGAELVLADHTIFLGDVDVTEQDQIVTDGATYEVLMVVDRQDGTSSHHKECFVRTVR